MRDHDRTLQAHSPTNESRTSAWFRTSLRTSILWWFLGISLVPLVILSVFGYKTAARSRERDIATRLESVSEIKRRSLQDFFDTCVKDLDHERRLDGTLALFTGTEIPPTGGDLQRYLANSPYHDILGVDPAGDILFSAREGTLTGIPLLSGPAQGSPLSQVCRTALNGSGPVFAPYAADHPVTGGRSAFLVHPVNDREGAVLGLLVFQLTTEWLTHLLNKDDLLGNDGQVYAVDADFNLLTVPPHNPWLPTQDDPLAEGVSSPWRRHLEPGHNGYDGMRAALPGAGLLPARYPGPYDEPMSGVHRKVQVFGRPLYVVAEINRDQFLSGLSRMKLAVIGMLLLVAVAVVVFGQIAAARIVHPLVILGRAMERVADGHDVRDLPSAGPREVGELAGQFRVMIEKLNEAKALNDHQLHLKRCQFELQEWMSGEPDPTTLVQSVLDYLAGFYGAQVGVLYLARAGQRLALSATTGLAENPGVPETLRFGEGLIGAAALQKRVQVIRDVPHDHFRVQTGLGESTPRCLVVAPFQLVGKVKGVMGLGLLENLDMSKLEFLRLVSESVATALDSAKSRRRVDRLLDETRRQATALSSQQQELREKNRRLARADRYKSEFLANMSHELRTPLNGMMIMSRVLADNEPGNLTPDQVEAAETISQAGGDLQVIINDILDLSRVEAGKMDLHFESVALDALIRNLQDLFRPVAAQAGLDFQVRTGPDLPEHLVTDPVRLSQVLKNLLNNAFKFTATGKVVLRMRRPTAPEIADRDQDPDREWVVISVADTGIGMSPEIQAQVFEAFNQGDGSIGRNYGGTGLGLSISSGLTSLLGGSLWADSAEGKGSRFSLLLPLAPGVAVAETVAPPANNPAPAPAPEPASLLDGPDLADRHVLVCDSDMRAVYALTGLLGALGARVTVARSWGEGRDVLNARPDVSLVLAATTLADEAGCDDFAAWRGLGGQQRQLVALLDPENASRATEADAVIEKPVSEEILLKALEHLPATETVEVGHDG